MSNKLPKSQQNQPQQQAQQVGRVELTKTETSVSFSPLPPAQELEALERIQPGIAHRILQLAENEQAMRHEQKRALMELEKKNQRSLNFNVRLGLVLGFGSVLVSTGMCVYFAHLGNIEAAADAAKWVIASLAAVFITGRIVQGKQTKEKE